MCLDWLLEDERKRLKINFLFYLNFLMLFSIFLSKSEPISIN